MCGIVGAFNFKKDHRHNMETVMRELIWADTLRGPDATGIYALTKEGKYLYAKEAVDGWTFLSHNKDAKDILFHAETHQIMICHNRSATQGSHKDPKYAHPIVVPKKLALVHNGTLSYWPKKTDKTSTVHDSTAIAQMIAKDGVQHFIDEAMGSYSLVWHDFEDNTLNFLRNSERPMSIVYTADRIFFGSEPLLLNWILRRNQFVPTKYFVTEPMSQYTFKLGESEPTIVKLTKKTYVSTGTSYAGRRFQGEEYDPYGAFEYNEYGGNRGAGFTGGRGASSHSLSVLTTPHRADPNGGTYARGNGTGGTGESTGSGNSTTGRSGNQSNASSTTSANEEKAEKVEEGNAKGASVTPIRGRKEHGRLVEEYKQWKTGHPTTFSIDDYSEPENKADPYTIQGYPINEDMYPEVQIRVRLRDSDFPIQTVADTDKFLVGMVSSIVKGDTGNVMIWVKNVAESTIVDPKWAKLPTSSKKPKVIVAKNESDGTAEMTMTLSDGSTFSLKGSDASPFEAQDRCIGCEQMFRKSQLKMVDETIAKGKNQKSEHRFFRFCEGCVLKYGNDRDSVVPPAARGLVPSDVVVKKMLH